ncbi:hypothetical protein IDJ77_01405 [Mucilaginibacter sp. ZT4R22]|uniref:Uncharacterized protein n=1 Tax=Mucilaginibacter pankratovii TaxID=2772110 RepID=A0ABR7WJF0_9SPHI|nr:hypothetical protein [Mucilaginibacter pankratovii]MBD1362453.1 hypothetical protein [Mucilaginibacter pankratovii]
MFIVTAKLGKTQLGGRSYINHPFSDSGSSQSLKILKHHFSIFGLYTHLPYNLPHLTKAGEIYQHLLPINLSRGSRIWIQSISTTQFKGSIHIVLIALQINKG